MPSTFTPINGGASSSRAAVARARVQPPARRHQRPGPINGTEKEKRKSPTTPDAIRMQGFIDELTPKLEREDFRWPTGITADNAVVASINRRGLPGALEHDHEPCYPDLYSFVLSAKDNSKWLHSKIAACIGRSEQASRLILFKTREMERAAATRAAQPMFLEPPAQTSSEAQAVADQLHKVSVEDLGRWRSWPDVRHGRDLSRLNALATTAAEDGPSAAAARPADSQSAFVVRGML